MVVLCQDVAGLLMWKSSCLLFYNAHPILPVDSRKTETNHISTVLFSIISKHIYNSTTQCCQLEIQVCVGRFEICNLCVLMSINKKLSKCVMHCRML